MIKIAAIYTGISPALMDVVESEAKKALAGLPGLDYQWLTFADPGVLAELMDSVGICTKTAYSRMIDMYWNAVKAGACVIYNICSSVGEIAAASAPLIKKAGVGFVRIDDAMALHAVKNYRRIGVVATVPTTLGPTCALIKQHAANIGEAPAITEILASGAYGKPVNEQTAAIIEAASAFSREADAFLLAQASMTACEDGLRAACGLPVLSSPGFGASALYNEVKAIIGM